MEHEKSIFLNECIEELTNKGVKISAVALMNMILYKGGDLIVNRKCRIESPNAD